MGSFNNIEILHKLYFKTVPIKIKPEHKFRRFLQNTYIYRILLIIFDISMRELWANYFIMILVVTKLTKLW